MKDLPLKKGPIVEYKVNSRVMRRKPTYMGWARVRRVRRGSISSELLMCGGGVHSILLLPLDNRCYVYGACLFLCLLYDCVGVCRNVCCVGAVVKNSGF